MDALGHDIIIDEAVEETCATNGLTEGSHCSRCDYAVEQQIIPSTHKIVTVPGTEATCTTDGLTDGYYCSRCDYVVEQQVISAGHAYKYESKDEYYHNTKCENCDFEEMKLHENVEVSSGDRQCEYCNEYYGLETGSQTTTSEKQISFVDKTLRTEYSTSKQVWKNEGITVTNNKGSSTSNVGDYANPARFYKSSELIISAESNITKIVIDVKNFDEGTKYYAGYTSSGHTNGTVVIEGTNVVITLTTPSKSFIFSEMGAQCRANSITVTCEVEHQHSKNYEFDQTGHVIVCECGYVSSKIEHVKTGDANCTVDSTCECGYVLEEKLNHIYSTTYENDDTYHWSVCTREGCTATTEKIAHSGGTATETEKANCEKCGVGYGGLAHTHTFNQNVDEKNLVSTANCENAAVYYKSCSCGKVGSETFTYGSALGHEWEEKPTEKDDEYHYRNCTRDNCNERKEEVHSGSDKCVCGKIMASEVTATLTFDNTSKRTEYTTSIQVWEESGITFTNNKGSSTSNVADYASPARLYKSSKVVVEVSGLITKIVFDCNSNDYAKALLNSIQGATGTVSGDKVTVTLDGIIRSSGVVILILSLSPIT